MPPDVNDYLRALTGIEQGTDEDSPFTGLQSGARDAQKFAIANSPKASFGSALLGGILTGAMSGLADRGQRGYQDDQNAQVQGALDNWRQGKTFDRGSMGSSVFNRLQNFTQASDIAKQQGDEAEASQLANAIKLKAAPNAKDLEGPKIPDKALTDIVHGNDLVSQVNDLVPLVDKMSDTNLGRVVASTSLDTPEGMYQNKLKVLSDELAKQFAGRSSWPSIEQQLSALTVRQLGSKTALKTVVQNLSQLLNNATEDRAGTYGQKGYDLLNQIKDGKETSTTIHPPAGAVATGKMTKDGKPVYQVGDKLWAPD